MDILTDKETTKFIKKLQGFNSKRGHAVKKLNILEPRFFDIILRKLGSTKVMEFERNSDSCSQICEKHGIKYFGVYAGIRKRAKAPKEWDGDIICGLADLKNSGFIAIDALKRLQKGRFFAIYQQYQFMESWDRYKYLFKDSPFQKVYLTPTRPKISFDGNFEDIRPGVYGGAWFVWEGGSDVKVPTIEWLDELWDEYFVTDKATGKNLHTDYFKGCRVYKTPVKVLVDRGIDTKKEFL